ALAAAGTTGAAAGSRADQLALLCLVLFLVVRSFGLRVDDLLGDFGELLVGGLLFLERRLEQRDDVVVAELFGVGHRRAVRGDLVVLGALRAPDHGRIAQGVVGKVFVDVLGAFIDDAANPVAGLRARGRSERLQRFLHARDVLFGLFQVIFNGRPQLLVRR